MGESITPIIIGCIIILLIGVGILSLQVVRLKKKIEIFMHGKDGNSLEGTLLSLTDKTTRIEETLKSHKVALEYIDARIQKSIRGYSLVKYNAYNDAGGDQSFASGLIDENKDGYILSVITNRNHVGIYAKKVINGTPDATLTEEERLALTQATQSLTL